MIDPQIRDLDFDAYRQVIRDFTTMSSVLVRTKWWLLVRFPLTS